MDEGEILFRRVLYAGVLGAGAVIAAWILFFTFQLGWGLIPAGLLGGALAAALKGTEHYITVARAEAVGGAPPSLEAPAPDGRNLLDAARIGGVVMVCVFLVCEHLLGDLIKHMIRPVLISVITLTPIAMLIAGLCFRGERDTNFHPIAVVLKAALFGVVAAAVACGLRLLAGLPVSWSAVYGWWMLVGIGLALWAFGRELKGWRVLAAVATALVIVIVIVRSGLSAQHFQGGQSYKMLFGMVVGASESALQSPDVPGEVWAEALARWERDHPAEPGSAPRESAWGAALASLLGLPDPAPPARAVPRGILQRKPGTPAQPPDPRQQQLSAELRKGWASGFLRSWTVLLVFALGLGVVPLAERALRPAVYAGSRTLRNDLILGGVILSLLIAGALVVRFLPAPPSMT